VLWGTDSDVLSETQAKKMVAALPNGTLVAVPDTEHAPSLTEPEAVRGLDAFLQP
jgi:pimeloyl-ACP methyl ester carboxylesterase